MDEFADVVVIGGGIVGLCIAHSLLDKGARRVQLVEKNQIGSGGTDFALGLIRRRHADPVWARLATESWGFFSQWREETRDGLVTETSVAIISHASAGAAASEETPYRLSPQEAIDTSAALRARPRSLAMALAQRLRGKGLRIREGVEALDLRTENGPVRSVLTTDGTINCGACVIAPGPMREPPGRLLPSLLRPMRVPIVGFTGCRHPGAPPMLDVVRGVYIAPDGDRWVVSVPPRADAPVDADPHPPSSGEIRMLARALRHRVRDACPTLAGARCGIYDRTPDERPLVGAVPGVTGLFAAAGLSGSGFQVAPAVGARIADLVFSEPTDLWADKLRPDRFSEAS